MSQSAAAPVADKSVITPHATAYRRHLASGTTSDLYVYTTTNEKTVHKVYSLWVNGKIRPIRHDRHKAKDLLLNQEALREWSLIQSISPHPYIVPLLDVTFTTWNIHLVIPYYPMSLHKAMTSTSSSAASVTSSSVTAYAIKTYIQTHLAECMTQLCIAIDHVHRHGIIHRDLKPENIMVNIITNENGDQTYNLVLIDFAISKSFLHGTGESDMTHYAVSRWYRAPEIMAEIAYDEKVDVWSLGCVLYELIVGLPLFQCGHGFGIQFLHVLNRMAGRCHPLPGWSIDFMTQLRLTKDDIEDIVGPWIPDQLQIAGSSALQFAIPDWVERVLDMTVKIDPKLRFSASQVMTLLPLTTITVPHTLTLVDRYSQLLANVHPYTMDTNWRHHSHRIKVVQWLLDVVFDSELNQPHHIFHLAAQWLDQVVELDHTPEEWKALPESEKDLHRWKISHWAFAALWTAEALVSSEYILSLEDAVDCFDCDQTSIHDTLLLLWQSIGQHFIRTTIMDLVLGMKEVSIGFTGYPESIVERAVAASHKAVFQIPDWEPRLQVEWIYYHVCQTEGLVYQPHPCSNLTIEEWNRIDETTMM